MTRKAIVFWVGLALLLVSSVESARPQISIGPQGPEDGVIRQQSWLIPAQDRLTMMRTRLFRPPGGGPFPLAVVNHGSTQSEIRRAGYRLPQYRALTEWLVARGYAVAVPQRPGHGETGGPYYEAQGGCREADFAKAGRAAASSIAAVFDFLVRQPFIRKRGAVALGHSAGGWAGLALATNHIPSLAGVVGFAPGLGGRADDVPGRTCAPERLAATAHLFGEKARVPSLWLYAENDSYFSPAFSRRVFDAYRLGGGRGEYRALPAIGADGHDFVQSPEAVALWGPAVEAFLKRAR